MICVKGKFFTKDGLIEDEAELETEIFNAIKFFVTEKVSNVVRSLMDVLKQVLSMTGTSLEENRDDFHSLLLCTNQQIHYTK